MLFMVLFVINMAVAVSMLVVSFDANDKQNMLISASMIFVSILLVLLVRVLQHGEVI